MRAPCPTAVVLTGGDARRLGGQDKARLRVGGRTLLDRVLTALPAAAEAVVVGPRCEVVRPVRFVREDPPGGGPVAALAAGLQAVTAERVWLLAGDLPFLTGEALAELARHPAAMAVDDEDRDQPLLSCWPAEALRQALPAEIHGAGLRRVLAGLDVVRVRLPGHPPPWFDCDTPQALAQARDWVGREGRAPLA
ncbi:MAG: molybdopterin-guanine dinucleotide synthase [Frankiales bacterium]|nr:molybdopterin-guanine dinucleotide synthase [Frankiales bacterium]